MYLELFWGIPPFWQLKFFWAMAHWLAFEFKPSCPHLAPSQFWVSRHEGCSKCNHCVVPPSELPPGWSSYFWSHLHQYWSHPYHSPTRQSWSPSYQPPRIVRSSSARWSFQLPGSQTELSLEASYLGKPLVVPSLVMFWRLQSERWEKTTRKKIGRLFLWRVQTWDGPWQQQFKLWLHFNLPFGFLNSLWCL